MSFKVAERSDGRLFSAISKCHCVGPFGLSVKHQFIVFVGGAASSDGGTVQRRWTLTMEPPPFAMLICDSIYRYK